ncbi:hypothetical protein [Solimonas soli]|uniref:hypothetical protein n=1 Tax=Solimonas soli TaxID=413479 RepID=UPI00048813C1|nr:hypothetical protein [Solimonas soli]
MLPRCLLLLCLALCAACGTTIRNNVTNAPQAPLTARQFVFTPVSVTSKSQTDDAKQYNEQLKAEAQTRLVTLVRDRKAVWVKAPAKLPTIVVTINADYGNRGIRLIPPLFRGKAGQALIAVDIQMKSADGHVLYATHTEGKLRRGLAGGDALAVAKRTVDDAFQDFAKRF